MIAYVLIGGMKGTTWVQIIKALLLIAGTAVITVMVLGQFGFSFSALFQAAADNSPGRREALRARPEVRQEHSTKIDFISLSMALVLGTAGLPHVLQRFYTVPTSKQARKSVEWAIWLIGGFYLLTLVVGYGAAALVGPEAILAAPGKANSAAPLLAYELGGSVLLGVISGIAFATILAVVAGLTITTSATFAHDLYKEVFKRGETTQDQEVRVARTASVVIGVIAILGGILAKNQNIAFLVALAFAVAASANLPTILYSLFWKGFNTRGALWSIYGGLTSAIVLIIFSPVVSGKPPLVEGGPSQSMITNTAIDFHWFPLDNPGLISIPLAFFLGWLGSVTSKEHNAQKYAEMEVRSLTGFTVLGGDQPLAPGPARASPHTQRPRSGFIPSAAAVRRPRACRMPRYGAGSRPAQTAVRRPRAPKGATASREVVVRHGDEEPTGTTSSRWSRLSARNSTGW